MSATQLARQRSHSSKSRQAYTQRSQSEVSYHEQSFEPCAATASLFLYSCDSLIFCLHHDTLAIERRFEKHVQDIQLISVDNVSERGAGRLVVSYDVGQTAIVWDLLQGQEIARFVSFEHITVAAWMRNGNLAFGNVKGEVILFEPSTSEHISARTIYDPITAIAPSSDCSAYAIGYQNGSILLATLRPTFTILHTLTTQQAPLPINALTWHASSSKQKSDMLASQTSDGDVRVWSVAKPPTNEAPRVIRTLAGAGNSPNTRHWIAWSKNGRIIQCSGHETRAWDVRTKNVTYETIPTVENPRGLAGYGPTATLFTLGTMNTVQQYDVERAQMVANVYCPLVSAPQTPSEDYSRRLAPATSESEEEAPSPITRAKRHLASLEDARNERAQATSPRSNRSWNESYSSQASSMPDRYEHPSLLPSQEANSTVFSSGTQSLMTRSHAPPSSSMTYPSSLQSPGSARSARKGSRLKQEVLPSPEERPVRELFPFIRARLSDIPYRIPRAFDEETLNPDGLRRQMLSVVFGWDSDIQELINDEISRHPPGSQNAVLLSKWLGEDADQMAALLSAGGTGSNLEWMMLALSGLGNQAQTKKIGQAFVERMLAKGDVHAAATILLSLGDRDDAIEVYVTRRQFMEATLLSCLLMPQNWQRISFLCREWGKHAVAASEQHLAIRCFSCTDIEPTGPWTSPTAQSAVQPLIRAEMADRPGALQPSATGGQKTQEMAMVSSVDAPQPDKSAPVNRVTAKNPALKLITSFGPQSQDNFRFPGLKSDDRTPTNAPGVTPIAESAGGDSAVTPGGLGSYKSNNARSINTALNSRNLKPSGFSRQRLSSIGETPTDINPPAFPPAPKALPTPADSGSDKEKDQAAKDTAPPPFPQSGVELPPLLTSAKYEPTSQPRNKETPLTAVAAEAISTDTVTAPPEKVEAPPRPISPPHGMTESRSRNGSRGRKPDGLSIQWPPGGATINEAQTGEMAAMAADLERSDTAGTYIDPHGDMTSPSVAANSIRTLKSPSVSGKSINQYISSLDEAQYHTKRHRRARTGSRERSHGKHGERKRSTNRLRAPSDTDRQEKGRIIPAAKKSPSSPISMSPAGLHMYNRSVDSFEVSTRTRSETESIDLEPSRAKQPRGSSRTSSKTSERPRYRSRSQHSDKGHKSRASSRVASRQRSPDSADEFRGRTRSNSRRAEPGLRSPRSPLPMSPFGSDQAKSVEMDQALRFVSNDRQRLANRRRSRSRSLSRRPERGTSSRRAASPDRRKTPNSRSGSQDHHGHSAHRLARQTSASQLDRSRTRSQHRERSTDRRQRTGIPELNLGPSLGGGWTDQDLEARAASNPQTIVDRRKKELAAAELEARRLSLARRPSAPSIPFPGQHMTNHLKSQSVGGAMQPLTRSQTDAGAIPTQSQNQGGRLRPKYSPNDLSGSDSNSPSKRSNLPRMGLPATPRAMRNPGLSPPSSENANAMPSKIASTLSNGTYRGDASKELPRSTSAPIPDFGGSPPGTADAPAHPAYDRRLPSSRSSSVTRDGVFSPTAGRNDELSREPPRVLPCDAPTQGGSTSQGAEAPPNLPELQHLASPPPPPPAPSMSRQSPVVHDGDVVNVGWPGPTIATENGPTSAPMPEVSTHEPPPATWHRRGRSINENFAGKIRSFTTRLRSTSRSRNARSPQADDETHSPYESIPTHIEYGVA